MKNIIILISVLTLVFGGFLYSNETNMPAPIPDSKIIELSGKIGAIMTEIPTGQSIAVGPPTPFVKIKVKDDKTGQEHSIQIAPGHFLRLKGLMLQKDDVIKAKVFKPENSMEVKSLQIEVKGRIFIVRDKYGKGLWEKSQLFDKKGHTIR